MKTGVNLGNKAINLHSLYKLKKMFQQERITALLCLLPKNTPNK